MNQPKERVTPKEDGEKCIKRFEKHNGKIEAVLTTMVTELNTRPLVLIPVEFNDTGNGMVLAFSLGDNKFVPVARIMSTDDLKPVVRRVELEGDYTLLPQAEVPGFKEFAAGELWT